MADSLSGRWMPPSCKIKNKEDMKMNTNMKELNINEMEQVNAGNPIAVAACVVGIAAAAIKVADLIYDSVKGR